MASYQDEADSQTVAGIPTSNTTEKNQHLSGDMSGPPTFALSHLWQAPAINPLNLKSYTLPIFNLSNPYSRNFHLSWLGFFVAFLSWFAFPPLIPEAIKTDLNLTTAQIGNSNIVSLCATLLVRLITGPLVDRFGPRKVMASLLVIGAIPSGLAGTVSSASGLYTVRFFIGILGGTFVPCQAWTTLFFDKSIVGRANAFVGGWGNAGGGVTFIVMTNLYQSLRDRGLTNHVAWRASFAIVPVPILLFVAALVMIFGTDCPAGKWSQRHETPATAIAIARGHQMNISADKQSDEKDTEGGAVSTVAAAEVGDAAAANAVEVDLAVNEPLTFKTALIVLAAPQTWLAALSYFTTFGLELAIDANVINILYAIYKGAPQKYSLVKCGYLTAVFGILNFVTRPFGGYCGDLIYKRYGVPGKKFMMLSFAFINGVLCLALGFYIQNNYHATAPIRKPKIGSFMGIYVVFAIFNEMANGVNFAMVPHLNSRNNGVMSGQVFFSQSLGYPLIYSVMCRIVGATGNFGGVIFAIIFRYVLVPTGKALWISGIVVMCLNAALVWIPVPRR